MGKLIYWTKLWSGLWCTCETELKWTELSVRESVTDCAHLEVIPWVWNLHRTSSDHWLSEGPNLVYSNQEAMRNPLFNGGRDWTPLHNCLHSGRPPEECLRRLCKSEHRGKPVHSGQLGLAYSPPVNEDGLGCLNHVLFKFSWRFLGQFWNN